MISNAQFHVAEYEGHLLGEPEHIRPVYTSTSPMCLRDASRFAAALSYARGAYVQVIPDTPGEMYAEWWCAGTLWSQDRVPPISGGAR